MRSLAAVVLIALCALLSPAGTASAGSPAPLSPPTLPAATTDHRVPATLGSHTGFRFVPLGGRFVAMRDSSGKTSSASLGGVVYRTSGSPVSGATVEWRAPVDGGWAGGSTTTGADGSYWFTEVAPATGNGELWCSITDRLLLGRTSASWSDAVTTTFDFQPVTLYSRLTEGGPWSDSQTVTTWLYGRDGLSDLVNATSMDTFGSGLYEPTALQGLYDKAAVYWWSNEGKEFDVRLRAVPRTGYMFGLSGVDFSDASHGWAVGATSPSGGLGNECGLVTRTADGGLTWSDQLIQGTRSLTDVAFVDETRGWAVGWDADYDGAILTTSDGIAWSAQLTETQDKLYAVEFLDDSHGWAVGAHGAILSTVDGGVTWTPQTSGVDTSLRDVDFCDALHGWAVGTSGTILATSDGGATWTPQTSGTLSTLNAVRFSDPANGCAIGDSALYTTDGGASWVATAYPCVQASALAFADESVGWAVGAAGSIAQTVDGGATWTAQRPFDTSRPEGALVAAACIDADRVWAVSSGGFMIDTEDGGAVWSDTTFAADETYAQRFTASSSLGASGNPGSSVKLRFTNFPEGYVSLLVGDPDFPKSAAARSLGSYTSRGGTNETRSVTVPKTAKPGYLYWFGTQNKNGMLYLEAPFQVSLLKASRATVSRGGSVKLSGVVPTQGHWGSTAGKVKRCALFRSTRSATKGYRFVKYVRANGYGVFNAGYQKPTRRTWYVVSYPGDQWYWADSTTPVKITVR